MSPEEKLDTLKVVWFVWTNVVLVVGIAFGFWQGRRWPR